MNKQQPTQHQISRAIDLICDYYSLPWFVFEEEVKRTYEQFTELRQILKQQGITIYDVFAKEES